MSEAAYHGFHKLPVLLQLLHGSGPPAAEASVALALEPVLPQPLKLHLYVDIDT